MSERNEKAPSKKINLIFIGIAILLFIASAVILWISKSTLEPGETQNRVNGIGNMCIMIGITFLVFNVSRIVIKHLRSKDPSGRVKTGAQAFWIGTGSFFLSFSLTLAVMLVLIDLELEMIAAVITFFLLAAVMMIPSFIKMNRKIAEGGYSEDRDRPRTSTKRKPAPSDEPEYPPEDKEFIKKLRKGRSYSDMLIGGFHGEATFNLDVAYIRSKGYYALYPEIDIHFNRFTVKTKEDVDDVIERVQACWDEEQEKILELFDRYGYVPKFYDPEVTTNKDSL